MRAPSLPHRLALFETLRAFIPEGSKAPPDDAAVHASTHPRAPLLLRALGHSDASGLPANVWAAVLKATEEAAERAGKPLRAQDQAGDEVLLALGGHVSADKALVITAEEAAGIGRAVVFALDAAGHGWVSKPKLETSGMVAPRAQPKKGRAPQFLPIPGLMLTFRGGHLGRWVVRVQAGEDRTPLAWAVAIWEALRAREARSDRAALPSPDPQPAVLTVRAANDDLRVRWGEFTGAELRRLDRELADGGGLDADDEEVQRLLAAWTAEAERVRDLEQWRLPGEVEGLENALEHFVQAAKRFEGSDREHDAVAARRVREWARDLVKMPADGPRLLKVREAVREATGGGDLRRRDKGRPSLTSWTDAIRKVEATHHRATIGEVEVKRWRGWAGEATIDGFTRADRAARLATAILHRHHDAPLEPWLGAALREIAIAGLERAARRIKDETAEGAAALLDLWAGLGCSWGPTFEGEDARRAAYKGQKNPMVARPGVVAETERKAGREALRVECERLVGLAVEVLPSLSLARRRVCSAEVAALVGRGQIVAVAEHPPRVVIGSGEQLARAGLVSLSLDGGLVVAGLSPRADWDQEFKQAGWSSSVVRLRDALRADGEPLTVGQVARLVTRAGVEVEGGRWLPASSQIGVGLCRPFEWRQVPIVEGEGKQAVRVGVEVRLRWAVEEWRVEAVLRRMDSGEDGADLRVWPREGGLELDLEDGGPEVAALCARLLEQALALELELPPLADEPSGAEEVARAEDGNADADDGEED